MGRKTMMMTTVALGAAYLLRNEKSRKQIMNQFQSLAEKSRR
ncbi:hypothetical protein [Neobacillus sp. Marseille-QA0830]